MLSGVRPQTRAALGLAALVMGAVGVAGCGRAVVHIEDGVYRASVPSAQQFALDAEGVIPGGFRVLRDAGASTIELRIEDDQVTFRLDGTDLATRPVVDRRSVSDKEGSGPFKAAKELLLLGNDALVVGGLVIEAPVIWPGSFDGSPIVTIKQYDPAERGPSVSCRSDEGCLVLTAPVDPAGGYANANDPDVDECPVTSIRVTDEFIEFTVDPERVVRTDRDQESVVGACGISETVMWEVPAEVGLTIEDPVLVHTECSLTPGASIQLIIMEREAVPVLAPLTAGSDGAWCSASPRCWWFAPT